MLDHHHVTTFATAQNFHSKRRTDSHDEANERIAALKRRFRSQIYTTNPDPKTFAIWLARRVCEWELKNADAKTIRLLVAKSGCNVDYAVGCLVKALGRARGELSFDFVAAYNPC